ncbi:MAG: hypothetical protein ABIZ09_05590, partial [Rhodoferax sp.]
QSVRDFARILGLVTPHGMSSFDWRAELAPGSLPSGEVLRLSSVRHTEDNTQSNQTNPGYAPTQFVDMEDDADEEAATIIAHWGPDSTPPENPSDRRQRPREAIKTPETLESASTVRRKKSPSSTSKRTTTVWRPAAVWALATCLLLITALAATWSFHTWSAKGKANASATSVSEQPNGMLLGASAPASAASAEAAINIANATDQANKGEPIETVIESSISDGPALAASAAAISKAAKARKAAKAAKVEAPRPPVAVEAPSEPIPAVVQAPAPAPKPTAPAVTAERLCADANFLTRPMCMFHACQRSDLSGSATCVELQKNLQRGKQGSESSKF